MDAVSKIEKFLAAYGHKGRRGVPSADEFCDVIRLALAEIRQLKTEVMVGRLFVAGCACTPQPGPDGRPCGCGSEPFVDGLLCNTCDAILLREEMGWDKPPPGFDKRRAAELKKIVAGRGEEP